MFLLTSLTLTAGLTNINFMAHQDKKDLIRVYRWYFFLFFSILFFPLCGDACSFFGPQQHLQWDVNTKRREKVAAAAEVLFEATFARLGTDIKVCRKEEEGRSLHCPPLFAGERPPLNSAEKIGGGK